MSKKHWETIYQTKKSSEVSWTQEIPKTSLDFIHSFELSKNAKIIDVGGGDSKLVDFLLEEGFENITVLDISSEAIKKSKKRLGKNAAKVKWIESDILEFKTDEKYEVWHDRAAFHFLTTSKAIKKYFSNTKNMVKENGFVTIGTFSTEGPKKCSGLEIKQYDEELLSKQLENGFEKIRCIQENHKTPFKTIQNFLFCSFKRRNN
ncbi:class I SAM-dependent methyltransferase [soil metagenome]